MVYISLLLYISTMKILCFFFFISLGYFVSAQQNKNDSVSVHKEIFEYKPRIFYPYDCSCPDRIIYKEVKEGDKNFNPYNYKEIKPIIIDSLKIDDQKKILDFIRKA